MHLVRFWYSAIRARASVVATAVVPFGTSEELAVDYAGSCEGSAALHARCIVRYHPDGFDGRLTWASRQTGSSHPARPLRERSRREIRIVAGRFSGSFVKGGMGRRKSLTGPLTERIAALLAPLGDPARIALLQAMREGGEVNIQELADEVDIPHRIASHHLTVLHRAGLIVRRREGRQVFYAVEDWSAWWLIEQAASVFDDSDALN